jgi:hypothetical protein
MNIKEVIAPKVRIKSPEDRKAVRKMKNSLSITLNKIRGLPLILMNGNEK